MLTLNPNAPTPVPLPVVDVTSGSTVRVWLASDKRDGSLHNVFEWQAHIVHGQWSHVPMIYPPDYGHLTPYRGRSIRVLVEWAGRRVGEHTLTVA